MSVKNPRRPLVQQWRNSVKVKLVNKSVAVEFLSSDNDEFGICIKRILTKEEVEKQKEEPIKTTKCVIERDVLLKTVLKLSREAVEALHYATGVAISQLKKTPKDDTV